MKFRREIEVPDEVVEREYRSMSENGYGLMTRDEYIAEQPSTAAEYLEGWWCAPGVTVTVVDGGEPKPAPDPV